MNIELLEALALKTLGKIKSHLEREPGHIYHHGLRTGKLAINLRKLVLPEQTDHDDIIYVAGLFHDIGKGIEPHAETGYAIAKHLLKDYLTPEELDKVSETIRLHYYRDHPDELPYWIKIIQDADILDHMGTTEIWLNFLYCAHEQRSIDRSLEWYGSDMFQKHILTMRGHLNYEASKQIWDEKVGFVQGFAARLKKESEGEIVLFPGNQDK